MDCSWHNTVESCGASAVDNGILGVSISTLTIQNRHFLYNVAYLSKIQCKVFSSRNVFYVHTSDTHDT